MELNTFRGDTFFAESGRANMLVERMAILENEFLTAGVLLEKEDILWWTPSQAGNKVREIRANFEEERIIDDTDIRSGVGYTAIAHLVTQDKIKGKPSDENPNITLYQTVQQSSNGV